MCLKELQIAFSEKLLLAPNCEGIQCMYEEFVCLFYDLPRDQIKHYYMNAVTKISEDDMYLEAVPLLSLMRLLTNIMIASGVHDFGLKDIFKPTRERTRRNISAIINLGKYREEKVIIFTEYSEKINIAMQQIATLEIENYSLCKDLESIQRRRINEKYTLLETEKHIQWLLCQFQYLDHKLENRCNYENNVIIEHYKLYQRNLASKKNVETLQSQIENSNLSIITNQLLSQKYFRHTNIKNELLEKIKEVERKKNEATLKKVKFTAKTEKNIYLVNLNTEIIKRTTYMFKQIYRQITCLKSRFR
jgi:hypothetical protein